MNNAQDISERFPNLPHFDNITLDSIVVALAERRNMTPAQLHAATGMQMGDVWLGLAALKANGVVADTMSGGYRLTTGV